MPSKDELNKLYLNKTAIGNFTGYFYWSSTENIGCSAWGQWFCDGEQGYGVQDNKFHVRAVGSF